MPSPRHRASRCASSKGILAELRRAGIVGSQRGSEGGYWLARAPEEVSVADVIRAVEGPLADVHGEPPEDAAYSGPAADLQHVWIATRVALRAVLEETTLAHIVGRRRSRRTSLALVDQTGRLGPPLVTAPPGSVP